MARAGEISNPHAPYYGIHKQPLLLVLLILLPGALIGCAGIEVHRTSKVNLAITG